MKTRILPLLFVLSACSLAQPRVVTCTSDAQCQTSFGPGATCAASGYCEVLEGCTNDAQCRDAVGFGAVCGTEGTCVDVVAHPRCTRSLPADLLTNPDAYRDRVVFGTVFDRNDSVHVGREHAIELAAVTINESGGFDERRFGVVFCDIHGGTDNPYDELSRPDAALAVGHWLVDTLGVPVVLGPSSSGDAESMYAEIIEPAEPAAILMSTAASSPSLTPLEGPATDENPGYLWRTAASAADQSVTVATDMRTRTPEIRNVAIVREMGAFGSGLAAPFVTAWTATGGTYEEFIYADGNATARSEQITRLGTRTAEFDAVYFIGQAADSRAFMAQVTDNAAYTTDLYYYFPQGGGNNDVFADASSSRLFTRVRAARPSVEATFEYQAFRDAYVARFDGLDPGTISNCPHGFDAMWVSALGAAWAASHETITGRSVARGIRQTFGGTVTASFVGSDWARSVTALQAGMRLDVTGASGPLDFDPVTEETMGAVELVEGQMSGTFVVLD